MALPTAPSRPGLVGKTAVILGTSHYGQPGRSASPGNPTATPLGNAACDIGLVDALAESGGPAVVMEDYCHSVEHSIEFQVLFLQETLGPDLRIVPILCGALSDAGAGPTTTTAWAVSSTPSAAWSRAKGTGLFFVLGIDMAHIGRRYGDSLRARADRGPLANVARRDRERIGLVLAGDADGFWADVCGAAGDDLRWCGASPLYTFLKTAGPVRGELLRYEQWNIDDGERRQLRGDGLHPRPLSRGRLRRGSRPAARTA
jgi:AmmeMemoRadiSam system protein B